MTQDFELASLVGFLEWQRQAGVIDLLYAFDALLHNVSGSALQVKLSPPYILPSPSILRGSYFSRTALPVAVTSLALFSNFDNLLWPLSDIRGLDVISAKFRFEHRYRPQYDLEDAYVRER